MIVHDLDIFSAGVRPTKTQTELIIDTDAMLPRAITFQGFQSISGRHPKIVQSARDLTRRVGPSQLSDYKSEYCKKKAKLGLKPAILISKTRG